MKRKMIFLTVLFWLPLFVYGDTINISCPSEVSSENEFTCDITGSTNNGVTDIKFDIILSNNLSFVTFVKSNGWNGDGEKGVVALYGDDTFKGSFKIGTLRLKSSGSSTGKIALNNVYFYNNTNSLTVSSISTNIVIKSNNSNTSSSKNSSSSTGSNNNNNNNTSNNNGSSTTSSDEDTTNVNTTDGAYLSNLTISGYDIDFRSDVFSYDIEIGNEDSLVITPTLGNDDSTYKIIGNENLQNGSVIYIEVTYKDDKMETYFINIKKEENKKKNYTPVFIAIIAILVIFNIVRLFFNRGKKDEGKE